MKKIRHILLLHLKNELNALFLGLTMLWCLLLILLNYHTNAMDLILPNSISTSARIYRYLALYVTSCAIPVIIGKWLFRIHFTQREIYTLLWGCVLMALRMSLDIPTFFTEMSTSLPASVYNSILENVFQGMILFFPLWIRYRWLRENDTYYGLFKSSGNLQGYMIMLAAMAIPVFLAAQSTSFQAQYPKYVYMAGIHDGNMLYISMFLLCYLLDFVSIELLFRGFLLKEGMVRMLMPVTAIYVSIHFGKPELETISSFAGGYILGILAIHTGSIRGGIWIHVGIAAMMELAGTLAQHLK